MPYSGGAYAKVGQHDWGRYEVRRPQNGSGIEDVQQQDLLVTPDNKWFGSGPGGREKTSESLFCQFGGARS